VVFTSVPAPLIGREAELSALTWAAGLGPPARSGLVLLSGDAGIGKSRLIAALGSRAGEAGWRVAVGHCLDLGGSPLPYLPFTEIAGRLAGTRPELMRQLVGRWPAVRRLLPAQSAPADRVQPAGSDAAAEPVDRADFFESLHAVLAELGRAAPLLVVIEDLHWADRSTCDLLSYLFTRGFGEPVSIVASYRSDDLHRRHPLRTIAAQWARLPGVVRIELPPLPDEEIRHLVRALHPGPLDDRDLQAVVERAEGNAFFTEELVAAVGSSTMPRDLAGLLLLRLDSLDPDARLAVRAAAAGGRQVRDAVLAAVTQLDPVRFEAAVRTAVELNVLVADEDGYRFRHSMLAEAVYEDLLPGERRRLHAAFVSALQAVGSRRTAADLARHAVAAEDHATAVAASVEAGDEAMAAGGPDEAARHYALALDLQDSARRSGLPVPGVDVVGLTERAAAAAAAAGHVLRAEAVVAEQLSRLPAGAPPRDRARLLVAQSEAALLSESSTTAVALAAEALDLVDPEPPTPLRSRAVATYAAALASERRDEEAMRWVDEGLAMPPEARVGEVTLQLQTVMARVSERGGDPAASERMLRQLLTSGPELDGLAEVRVRYQLGWIALEQGELEEALTTFQHAAERSAELGRPFAPYGADSRVLAGLVAYQLGQWDLALRVADVAGQKPPALAAAGLAAITLAVRAGRGATDGWPELMARVRPEWTTDGMVAIHSTAAAIDLYGDAGHLDDALAVYDDVLACVSRIWRTDEFQGQIRLAGLLLGQIAGQFPSATEDRRKALLVRGTRLAAAAERSSAMGRRRERGLESQAWLARVRAELLRLRRAAGEAVEPADLVAGWRSAVDAFARYGQPFEQARSQARLAAALRSAGELGRASEVARGAEHVAVRLRAAPLLAELRPLTGTRPGGGAEVLTPREVEVLRLVAEGHSNREIGERLVVSGKTASVHVSNILAKLGARTRTEAAAVARRRGLLE
jgi:DNA-binding CsgD family transcriptional regulator/tetratricopeptide (TPR) repeat protein